MYFSMEDELNTLEKILKLDMIVTVIDVLTLYDYMSEIEKIREDEMAEGHDKQLTNLIVNQIEFANVILINKADLMDKNDINNIYQIIENINSNAEILITEFCQIDINKVIYL